MKIISGHFAVFRRDCLLLYISKILKRFKNHINEVKYKTTAYEVCESDNPGAMVY